MNVYKKKLFAQSPDLLKDIVQWDVYTWSKAILFWEENVNWNDVQNGLELGGHQGGLSLWLAMKGIDVVCSDLKDVKLTALKLHEKYPLIKSIQYEDIDATNIHYENHFDVIVFKSILGGIGRDNNCAAQKIVIDQVYKALKPGGKLLFAENAKGSRLLQWLRKKFVGWGSSWNYLSADEMQQLLKLFSSFEIKSTGVIAAFGNNESLRRVLATIDNKVLNYFFSHRFKYVLYGYAQK